MTPEEAAARDARQDARRQSFDAAAAEYDRYRPGYPETLFDALATQLPPPARVLEIASGTGHATLPLAQRGYQVHCIELGEKLAAFSREKLAAFPNVSIEVGRFEDTSVVPASADLCVIGSAFHWLQHKFALPKIASALRSQGLLALLWSTQFPDDNDPVTLATRKVYLRRAPELAAERSRESAPMRMAKAVPVPGILLGSPDFTGFSRQDFRFKKALSTHDFLGLLGTHSNVLTLAAPVRTALMANLAEVLDREFGGSLESEVLSVLQLARRR